MRRLGMDGRTCERCGGGMLSHQRRFCSLSCRSIILNAERAAKKRRTPIETPPLGAAWLPVPSDHAVLVDEADLALVSRIAWKVIKNPGGLPYVKGTILGTDKRTAVYLHRVIIGLSDRSQGLIDHRDGNTLNNRRSNLRITDGVGNAANSKRKNRLGCTSSKFKGVSLSRKSGKWHVRIRSGSYRPFVGMFDDEIEAAKAYDAAARLTFGEFACVNFPGEGERGAIDVG